MEPTEVITESLRTVGTQLREYRDETNVRLQTVEQAIAHQKANGTGIIHGGPVRVSADILEDGALGQIEALRDGTQKTIRLAARRGLYAPRAATTSAGAVPAWRDPEIYGALVRPISVRDLIPQRTTNGAAVEYARSTASGAAAIQAAEGDQKAELALSLTVTQAQVRTIAAWTAASRQVLDDMEGLRDHIDTQLMTALRAAEDAQLLNGDGTGGNIAGLVASATAYNRAQTGDTRHDVLRRACTQVQLGQGTVTGFVLHPTDLEGIELKRDSEGRYLVEIATSDGNNRATIWRVPVACTTAMAQGSFLAADFTQATRLYDRQQATIEIATQHADYFTRNLVAILAEERLALTIPRPDLVVYGSFA